MNNDAFADLKAEIENKDTLEPEQAGDQWESGDVCGKNGCEKTVHTNHFPRDPNSEVPPHDSYSEFEFVCVHHGIVATR